MCYLAHIYKNDFFPWTISSWHFIQDFNSNTLARPAVQKLCKFPLGDLRESVGWDCAGALQNISILLIR